MLGSSLARVSVGSALTREGVFPRQGLLVGQEQRLVRRVVLGLSERCRIGVHSDRLYDHHTHNEDDDTA